MNYTKELEEDGFLKRTKYPEIPPRVEYSITELGASIFPIIDAARKWGGSQMPENAYLM